MDNIYLIIPAIFLPLMLTIAAVLYFRKKSAIRKVNALSTYDKSLIINRLAEPAGYMYDPCQDIFTSRLDASQKIFGYTVLYDLSAPYFNMIFDCETIYFDYDNRTWLIEMWKGQYGINSGCELGVYYADKIIPDGQYPFTLFKAVDSADMPKISLKLNRHCSKKSRKCSRIGYVSRKHWWLTIFKMGLFSEPENLFVNTSITFKNHKMLCSFLDSFRNTLPDTYYKTVGLTVYFTFSKSNKKYSHFRKILRRTSLFICSIYCKWFNRLTKPFAKSGDKILYIYYYLPFVSRKMFRKKKK